MEIHKTRQTQEKIVNIALAIYTTHSTYKGPYPFQTGPMQKIYRILTSMDPMHVLLTDI